jgi:hypothetical protein
MTESTNNLENAPVALDPIDRPASARRLDRITGYAILSVALAGFASLILYCGR